MATEGRVEIKLLNQINDSEHHSVMVAYDDDKVDGYNDRVTEGNRSDSGWELPKIYF